ncbi:MAG: signal peptidase II [Alphaproteobacteria bacterium]
MIRFGLVVAALVVAFDQATKWFVVHHVMDPPTIIAVTGFIDLVMVWNRGVSFGFFGSDSSAAPLILSALAAAIVVVLFVWMRRVHDRFLTLALGLVIGGAIGNIIDRLQWGAVADFISVTLSFIPLALFNPWPAFNVADAAISIGVVLILVDGLFRQQPKR